jgi:indole-3-glycerol phosphate synthase/phosphoribosylanthranilate isomerase
LDPSPTRRSLRSAIARPGARFIMEVKQRSPSGHHGNFDLVEAVSAYAPVADAVSVLTDEPFFSGSLDDLRKARAQYDGPILAKDFVIDPRQVREARLHGADAVLAILNVLDDADAIGIMIEARRLAMDVVVEVHNEKELGRAIALGADIIGINNRDLRTLKTDLLVTERLAPLIPKDCISIGESGIGSRRDVEPLSGKVDAFLVGSSLMASGDIFHAARALVFGPVKVCGLTRAIDVEAAARAGATHAGFIFAEESPRRVDNDAALLAANARQLGLRPVGVFSRNEPAEIAHNASRLELQAVQLHGEQDARELRSLLPADCEIWTVSGVGDAPDPPRRGADRTLFDTLSGGRTGGTGQTFDWNLVAERPDLPDAFIAGGIGPANARAAQCVGAFGLDVGSSVEAAPGRKEQARLQALFDALRLPGRGALPC